jgi:hypothetical protein
MLGCTPVVGDAADLDLHSALECGIGFWGDDVVGAFTRGEIEAQETLDFVQANGGESAGGAALVALDEEREAEQIADPANADLGSEQGAVAGLPVFVASRPRLCSRRLRRGETG